MSRKARARVASAPAKCPCEAKQVGWKMISGVLSGYSDLANVGTLSATSGDMREAGATTPILHLFCSSKRPMSPFRNPSVALLASPPPARFSGLRPVERGTWLGPAAYREQLAEGAD